MKNFKNILFKTILILSVLFAICIGIYLIIFYFNNYDPFGIKILQTVPLDLRSVPNPITSEQLYNPPVNWNGFWFDTALSKTALKKLKRYMEKNNLAIVPNEYVVNGGEKFEELLDVFDFVGLDKQ